MSTRLLGITADEANIRLAPLTSNVLLFYLSSSAYMGSALRNGRGSQHRNKANDHLLPMLYSLDLVLFPFSFSTFFAWDFFYSLKKEIVYIGDILNGMRSPVVLYKTLGWERASTGRGSQDGETYWRHTVASSG